MKHYDITLITAEEYENPLNPDWYVQQILEEDGLVQAALEDAGWRVNRVAWSGNFDWFSTHFALFRTPWDYAKKFKNFSDWLAVARKQVHFINPLASIYWNSDKHYLAELKRKGVATPDTHFIKKGTKKSLVQIHQELGWNHTVLKPTISAAGRHTYQLHQKDWDSYEALFQRLIAEEDMLLQPFLNNVVKKGEIAIMLIGGDVTHAVLKTAKAGDFRVQDDFGGTVQVYEPSMAAVQLAQKAVASCPTPPLYARVDLVWDNEGKLAVSELEIFEPEMWFRFCPTAATHLATVLSNYIQQKL